MEKEFYIKHVNTRMYVLICLVLLVLIFVGLEFSIRHFKYHLLLPFGLVIFTLCFMYFYKIILRKWFTSNIKISFSEKNTITLESNEEDTTYSLAQLKKYKIDYRKPNFYVFEMVTISNTKFRYKFEGENNSVMFLDKFNELVIKYNSQVDEDKKIQLIPPFETTKLNQNIINISGILLIIAFCFHVYYSAVTSIGSFLIGINYYLSSISLRKEKNKFLEHLKSSNTIGSFEKK